MQGTHSQKSIPFSNKAAFHPPIEIDFRKKKCCIRTDMRICIGSYGLFQNNSYEIFILLIVEKVS